MATKYVLGIDSSTQSCKAVLVHAETGEVIDQRRQPHPEGTQIDPVRWLEAMDLVASDLLEQASAVSVAGQQHEIGRAHV